MKFHYMKLYLASSYLEEGQIYSIFHLQLEAAFLQKKVSRQKRLFG